MNKQQKAGYVAICLLIGSLAAWSARADNGGLTLTNSINVTLEAHRTEKGDNESQNADITGGKGGYPTGYDPYATGANFDCCGTEYGASNLRDYDVGTNFSYGKYSDGTYAIAKSGPLTLKFDQPRLVSGIAVYNGYTNRDNGTYRLLDAWGTVHGAWTIDTPAGDGTNEGADSFWLRFKAPFVTDQLVLESTSSEADGTVSYREIVGLFSGPITLHGIALKDVYAVSWPASSDWEGDASSVGSPGHLIRQENDVWLQLNADKKVIARYNKRQERQFTLLMEGDGHLLEIDFDRNRIQKRHAGGAVRWTRTIHQVSRTPDDTLYQNYAPTVSYSAKGRDATYVAYGDKNALGSRRYAGHFEQLTDGSWRHMVRPRSTSRNMIEVERFRETGRDEWSVFLQGASATNSNVRVHLNLWLKTVKRDDSTDDVTGAGNTPPPTAAELAQAALIARQDAEANYDRMLRSPVSARDLDRIMTWIAQEAATEAVGFCYKNSAPRVGYPWRPDDPPLPTGYPSMIARCEVEHGTGRCAEDAGVVYPQCKTGFQGIGPICWQSCPTYHDVQATGQNVKFDCGALCAMNRDECARGVNDMVHAPINLVLNILTAGAAASAQNAAYKASSTAIESSVDAVKFASIWGQAAVTTPSVALGGASAVAASAAATSAVSTQVARATVGSVLKETFKLGATSLAESLTDLANNDVVDIAASIVDIASDTNGAVSSLTAAANGISDAAAAAESLDLMDDIGRWSASYGKRFSQHTSGRIERIIDQQFSNADDRAYIKQKFGHLQLGGMVSADGWETASKVLSVLSVEPTGVVALVAAFAHPVCKDGPTPFPNVQILPASQRPAFDPLTRAQ